jgi:serine phosphatase RsbU (regulator of sigma subunit)/anti-sigma regulatory factor (Ser/Thr protein kinase)
VTSPSFQPVRPATLRLAFAPNAASARAVAAEIRSFLARQGVSDRELFSCELCLAEAANNAVEYADRSAVAPIEPVAEALFTPEEIELRVTDHTAGFDFPERLTRPSPHSERGRGLFIIKSVMDEVRYLRGTRENILIMRKRRQPGATPAPGPDAPPAPPLPISLSIPAPAPKAGGRRPSSRTAGSGPHRDDRATFRAETLSSLVRSYSKFGPPDDFTDGFSDRLLGDLLHLTSTDWCVLRVLSLDDRQLEVVAASEPGLVSTPIALAGRDAAEPSLEAGVAASRLALRFDLAECPAGEPLRSAGADGTGLICPLCFDGALVGTMAVGRRDGGFHLGKLQEEVVQAFAEFLAIQTVNLRRHKQEDRNRVMARELEIAREIQHLLLPHALPQPAGFGLAGGWHSAREVSGDFYDAIPLGERSLLLMIADVMGKGVPAALFSTTMRGLLRGLAARSPDPAYLLSGLNRLLHSELAAVEMFITAQIVHIDLQTRQVTAASAGHCPLLLLPRGETEMAALPTRGLPLGVLPDTLYANATAVLGDPAVLLLHTDGLTDVRDAAGARFGQARLMRWLQEHSRAGQPAEVLRDQLTAELTRFRGAADMADDQAFLLMREETPAGWTDEMSRRLPRFEGQEVLSTTTAG